MRLVDVPQTPTRKIFDIREQCLVVMMGMPRHLELLKPIDLHKTRVFLVHFLGGREEQTEEHLRSCPQSKTTETRDGEKYHRQR